MYIYIYIYSIYVQQQIIIEQLRQKITTSARDLGRGEGRRDDRQLLRPPEEDLGKETPYQTSTSQTIVLIHRFGIFGWIIYICYVSPSCSSVSPEEDLVHAALHADLRQGLQRLRPEAALLRTEIPVSVKQK